MDDDVRCRQWARGMGPAARSFDRTLFEPLTFVASTIKRDRHQKTTSY
jgi:hypothetical protein